MPVFYNKMASTPQPDKPNTPKPGGRFAGSWIAKSLLAIGSPVVLLLVLELILSVFGVGRNTDFFISDEEPGVFRTNPRYTELFFPASFGLKPLNFRLPKNKPNGSYRVFVLGESAAMGVPEPGFSVSVQLQAQLRAVHPQKSIDVYNLGITAINSHVIRHIAKQAADFGPDLVVLYMGNNEVVGPYGPSSALAGQTPPLGFIRASIWVRSTRIGQLLERLISGLGRVGRDFKEWRGMEMFAGKTVAANDPRLNNVYENFSSNLRDIIETFSHAGIKVAVSTVAVNVKDSAPFASAHRATLSPSELAECDHLLGRANDAKVLGNLPDARKLLEQAIEIDPEFAETHFMLARVLEKLGEPNSARDHYLEALHWDALRFRCDQQLNTIIREQGAAASPGVSLVDAAREMGAAPSSTVEPAGRRFFFEHVHLRWEGNYELARMLAQECSHALFDIRDQKYGWLTPEACANAVGYTKAGEALMLLRMDELTTRPPFTSQRTYAEDRERLQTAIATENASLSAPGVLEMALGVIEGARRRDPSNAFLIFHEAAVRTQMSDFPEALKLNESLDAIEPASPERAVQRAYLLLRLGRTADAEKLLLHTAGTDPYYFQTYGILGSLWSTSENRKKALDFFHDLVARMPGSRGARSTYAQLLSENGDWANAEEQWLETLRISPDNEGALKPLLERYFERGLEEKGLELMLNAFAYNSRSFENNARLVQVFQERGDVENTVKYMTALAKSGPVNVALHIDLARNLLRLGDQTAATVELHRALTKARAGNDLARQDEIEQLIENIAPVAK